MAKATNEVLTTKEACEYLRISRPTYLKLIYTNQIRAKKVGKGWKVLRSELRAYFEQLETGRFGGNRKRKEPVLGKHGVVDAIDQEIIRKLSLHDHLTPLQLWYELSEDRVGKESITAEDIRKRLESLVTRGVVERAGTASFVSSSGRESYWFKGGDFLQRLPWLRF